MSISSFCCSACISSCRSWVAFSFALVNTNGYRVIAKYGLKGMMFDLIIFISLSFTSIRYVHESRPPKLEEARPFSMEYVQA